MAEVPLPRPRPPIPIPTPNPFRKTQERQGATGQPVRRRPIVSPQRTPAVGYGALRDPMANADPHNEVPNAPPPVATAAAEPAFDPAAAQAQVQLIAQRLRRSLTIAAAPTAPLPPPNPLAVLRARVDASFKMPAGIPYEQLRQMSIRNWERSVETGATVSHPPVMDPLNDLINPADQYMAEWDANRQQEGLDRLRVATGTGTITLPAPSPGEQSVQDVLSESQRLIDEARTRYGTNPRGSGSRADGRNSIDLSGRPISRNVEDRRRGSIERFVTGPDIPASSEVPSFIGPTVASQRARAGDYMAAKERVGMETEEFWALIDTILSRSGKSRSAISDMTDAEYQSFMGLIGVGN